MSRFAAGAAVLLSLIGITTALAVPPAPAGFRLNGDPKRGRASYTKRCALCHGDSGDGHGSMTSLKPPPADFRAPGVLAKRTDWELYLVVRDGGPAIGLSPSMFGWGKMLSDQEIRDVTAYVRSLAPAR